jgi:hypothetical protein
MRYLLFDAHLPIKHFELFVCFVGSYMIYYDKSISYIHLPYMQNHPSDRYSRIPKDNLTWASGTQLLLDENLASMTHGINVVRTLKGTHVLNSSHLNHTKKLLLLLRALRLPVPMARPRKPHCSPQPCHRNHHHQTVTPSRKLCICRSGPPTPTQVHPPPRTPLPRLQRPPQPPSGLSRRMQRRTHLL